MSLEFVMGVVGAEERDQLLSEGMRLFSQIRDEHFGFARNKSFIQDAKGNVSAKFIPWMEEEAICIALALFARKTASAPQTIATGKEGEAR